MVASTTQKNDALINICVETDWETDQESSSDDDDDDDEEGSDLDKTADTSQDSSRLASQDDSGSDEEAPQCPICLARLKQQDVGTPDSCDHSFCLDCLLEWSKVRECE